MVGQNMQNIRIGNRIRRARKKEKMTQKELAERIGRTANAVSMYERGLVSIPKPVLDQIAFVLEKFRA